MPCLSNTPIWGNVGANFGYSPRPGRRLTRARLSSADTTYMLWVVWRDEDPRGCKADFPSECER